MTGILLFNGSLLMPACFLSAVMNGADKIPACNGSAYIMCARCSLVRYKPLKVVKPNSYVGYRTTVSPSYLWLCLLLIYAS